MRRAMRNIAFIIHLFSFQHLVDILPHAYQMLVGCLSSILYFPSMEQHERAEESARLWVPEIRTMMSQKE